MKRKKFTSLVFIINLFLVVLTIIRCRRKKFYLGVLILLLARMGFEKKS